MAPISQVLRPRGRPALAAQLARAFLSRKPARGAAAGVPRLEVRLEECAAEPAALARYRAVCGFEADGFLPLPYPQVLAGPLHLLLLNQPAFPYPLLGMVHVRNLIRQRCRLPQGEPYTVRAWTEGQREVRRGRELDLRTCLEVDGAPVWEAVTTLLHRLPGAAAAGAREEAPAGGEGAAPLPVRHETWEVDARVGWRYARASGDYNPIHLHALAARPFGFPRAIAHGMWTLARCVAALGGEAHAPVLTLAVQLRRPLLLPARVEFSARPEAHGWSLRVSDAQQGTPHLVGRLAPRLEEAGR